MTRIATIVLTAVALLGVALHADTPNYHLWKKVDVGGRGAWDYLTYDDAGHRVFISRLAYVMVGDGESGAKVGEVPDTPGVHGIALAPDLGRGFTSNGHTNSVTIFDLKTLRPIDQVPTGNVPDAIVYDAASKRVFTMNARGQDATAIDGATGRTVGTIPLSGRPEFAVSDGKGTVFVNITDKHTLTAIDAQTLTVKSNWDMPGCEGPSGLSMDRDNRRLFSGCDNKVMAIVDADSGKLITTVPIGGGVDATAFDPHAALAFSSNGEDGTLTVVHEDSPDKFRVVENVPTESGARTMAVDPASGTVYLVTATVGPKLLMLFVLEIFRSVARPFVVWAGGICLLISLLLWMRGRYSGWSKKFHWSCGALLAVGLIFLVWYWKYDAFLMALSPGDFHLTMWR